MNDGHDWASKEATKRSTGFAQALPVPAVDPLADQVGGSHYKSMAIQPIEFSMANRLDACQHTVLKYVVRRKGDKAARLQDIDKAMHTLRIYRRMIEEDLA